MATSLRFLRINYSLMFNSLLRNTSLNGTVHFGINRFIFTENCLGVIGYANARSQIQRQFANVEVSFRQKMKEILQSENSIVFTEDLKAMVHLVNKNPEDINLVLEMVKKFNTQNKDLRFGTYIFGPVIMRAFYYLNEPDIALSTFLDEKLTYFFDQNMSYTILTSLLYKNGKYSDIRKICDIIKLRSISISTLPRNILIITTAACYSENTPEALQYVLAIWKELAQKGIGTVRRVVTYTAGLALKQNAPEIALEILSGVKGFRYIDNRCLKMTAYCQLNRHIDILSMLKMSLNCDDLRKEYYFYDTIELIKESIKNANEDIKNEINKLLASITEKELIDKSQTLETHLNKPIEKSVYIRKRSPATTSRIFNEDYRKRVNLKDLL